MKKKTIHVFIACTIAGLLQGGTIINYAVEDQPCLYYGINVVVETDGQLLPLIGIQDDHYVLHEKGSKLSVSMDRQIQIKSELKFDRQYITIDNAETALTSREYQRLLNEYNQLLAIQMESSGFESNFEAPMDLEDQILAVDMEMAEALANPDTVTIQLTFTPHWAHSDVYLLGLAHFSSNDSDNPGKGVKAGFLNLGDVEKGGSRSVAFNIQGLPYGSKLDQLTYHFFSKGREIPTNESMNRRLLNEEETHQFFMLQYLAANEGKTRGPSLYEPLEKAAFENYLKTEDLENVVLTVLIDKNGKPKDVVVKSGLTKFQKEICELATQALFFPTLKDGVPVEQKVNIRLSSIVL